MGTGVIDQADLARRRPERDQVLAEQPDSDGWAIGPGKLVRRHGGDPVLSNEVAHDRPWACACDEFIVIN